MRICNEKPLARMAGRWIPILLVTAIFLSGCRTFRKSTKGDLESMAETVSEVIEEPELASAIVRELEVLEAIYREYREEQVRARQRIQLLLDDYDATREDILIAFEDYNELRRKTLQDMQAVGQSIRASTSAAEWEEMEKELQKFITRIISL